MGHGECPHALAPGVVLPSGVPLERGVARGLARILAQYLAPKTQPWERGRMQQPYLGATMPQAMTGTMALAFNVRQGLAEEPRQTVTFQNRAFAKGDTINLLH